VHATVTRTLVKQVMTIPVITAAEAMPFRDLVALLHARDISAVRSSPRPGQVLGIVSRVDLIMTTPAVTITPQASVQEAARVMRRHKVGRLPVTKRHAPRPPGHRRGGAATGSVRYNQVRERSPAVTGAGLGPARSR
jgi:CBS domain-containing protein